MTIGILRRCLPATVLILVFLGATARAIEVKRVVSPTGLEAWLVEDHTNPIVAVRFAFRGGAALDPTGKEGLADVVSSLLDEGAGELDSQAFQRRLEDMAITLRFDAGYETFGGRLTTLSVNVGAAFDLLRLALTQPRFDDEPVARIRSQILTMIRRNSEDPDVIAGRTLRRALFPDHPYGRPVMGTEDSVKAITAADLKVFTAERLARDNLVIGVVGDMTPDRLAALLDGTFGGLPGQAAPWRLPEVAPIATGRTIVVKKAVPQSAILFAQAGVKRDDKDFYPAYIMNYILGGGGFTSRLYNEVREKRGLAYSVYTALSPWRRRPFSRAAPAPPTHGSPRPWTWSAPNGGAWPPTASKRRNWTTPRPTLPDRSCSAFRPADASPPSWWPCNSTPSASIIWTAATATSRR